MNISESTRRDIFDFLRMDKIKWNGRLNEIEFLSKIFDLNKLPSNDYRFRNAYKDIWQHCINNFDWDDDWIYSDARFDLQHCEDEIFLRFLCQMIHPIVRSDEREIESLVKMFNDNLISDGWHIVEVTRISQRPVYAGKKLNIVPHTQLSNAKQIAYKLDSNYIGQQITRMEAAIVNDPELAIGTAKEFVETICKTILHENGETVGKECNIPDLVKRVRSKIGLLPENISDEAKGTDIIKRLLSNLGTIAQALAELRSLYGSGHGKNMTAEPLQPRHARLAVNAATTLGVFLFETHEYTNQQNIINDKIIQ